MAEKRKPDVERVPPRRFVGVGKQYSSTDPRNLESFENNARLMATTNPDRLEVLRRLSRLPIPRTLLVENQDGILADAQRTAEVIATRKRNRADRG